MDGISKGDNPVRADGRKGPGWLGDKRLWLLCLVFIALGVVQLNDMFLYTPDSARYLVWANSLASFRGFIDLTGPDPMRYVVHAPLYAVLLAPVAALFPSSVVAAKLVATVCGLLLLVLFYRWTRNATGATEAFVGTLVLAINPLMILYSAQILSDVAFGCVFLGVVLLIEEPRARIGWKFLLLVAAASAAILLREVGATLVIALGLFQILRKAYTKAAIILLLPFLLYLLWYARNEMMVAPIENPPLQNTKLFVVHLFTVQGAGLIAELWARCVSNVKSYLELATKLVFLTQYHSRGYGVIMPGSSPFVDVAILLRHAWYIYMGLPALLFLYGMWISLKRLSTAKFVLLFLILYLGLVLVYPFNDVRFLFPVLLLVVHYAVMGGSELWVRFKPSGAAARATTIAGVLVLAILLVPNAAWTGVYVRTCIEYAKSPEHFFASVAARPDAPELLEKPLVSVGEWIRDNSEEESVIASRWKETAFWIGNRKLLELNPMVPLELLEYQLRDYQVKYLVTFVDRSGLREFESQMQQTTRFSFHTVYRAANLEILSVNPRPASAPAEWIQAAGDPGAMRPGTDMSAAVRSLFREQSWMRYTFQHGLRLLETGKADEAVTVFGNMRSRRGRSGVASFYQAVALEFDGRFDEAKELLERIRIAPQAGPLLVHSHQHLQLIDLVQRAEAEAFLPARASLFHSASLGYWQFGFKRQAEEMLRRCLDADSTFVPGLVFGAYYALRQGDLRKAKLYERRFRLSAPSHPLLVPLGVIISNLDRLRAEKSQQNRTGERFAVAQAYVEMGLPEAAIDELLALLGEDGDYLPAMQMLADLYVERQRLGPARRMLERVVTLDPTKGKARQTLSELLKRW